MTVTEAPDGSVWVSVPVAVEGDHVFVSSRVHVGVVGEHARRGDGERRVLVGVPLSSTAVGGSLTAATVMPRVAESDSAVLSVTVNVDGAGEGRRALGGVAVGHVAQSRLVGGRRRGAASA